MLPHISRVILWTAYTAIMVVAGCAPELAPSPEILRISYSEDPETLNPITSGDLAASDFQQYVYEQLATRKMEDPDELVPCLAEKWEFDESRLEYTIHLRHGVKWHPMTLPNGTPLPAGELTARDVQFTFDCILNPHVAASARSRFENADAEDETDLSNIEVETIDDYTCKVRWRKRYFLAEPSTLLIPIIPRHVFSVDAHGDLISLDFSSQEFAEGLSRHWAGTMMCGTGPLRFVQWNRNEGLTLEQNPDYWGTPFHFKRVIFESDPNTYTLLQKLLHDEIDWADIDDKDLYEQSRHDPAVESGKVELKTYDYPGYRYIGYNLRRSFLKEKQVRRALTHAVPIDEIIQVVFDGLATKVTGPFIHGSKAYNRQVKPLDYDLDQARELLRKAGWHDTNGNGTLDKTIDGRLVEARINLLIEANSSQYLTVAQIVQSHWRRIGVHADITPAQQSLMTERTRNKDFDAVLLGWSLDWDADPYQTWFGGNAELSGTANMIGYDNPEVDKLTIELRATFKRARQIELYHRIHQLIYDDQPYTFLFSEKSTCGYSGRLRNVNFYDVRPCVNFQEWRAVAARE